MKEEILTAKEWLEKETGNYLEIFSDVKHEMIDYNQFEQLLESYLEKYADYKSRILEDRIKEFREKLKDLVTFEDCQKFGYLALNNNSLNIISKEMIELSNKIENNFIVKEYDKHFNIQ